MASRTYYIKGMHCASCELVIEKKLLEIKGVKAVDASLGRQSVVVESEGEAPSVNLINKLLKDNGYTFSDQPFKNTKTGFSWSSLLVAVLIIGTFLGLGKLGLTSLINLDGGSSLPAFFLFGLIAGLSSCAALVGGLVLSLSKQWLANYQDGDSMIYKAAPHLLFNAGRILSYGLFGAILGLIGQNFQFSSGLTPWLIVAVSIVMALLACQMLGMRWAQRFQLALPKSVTHRIADQKQVGRFTPFIVGALTFFLPCGFTLVAQGLAVLSGSAVKGGLIMALFALGTFLPLMAIGISSFKLLSNQRWSKVFQQTAGLLILFFVAFNLNTQFNFSRLWAISPAAYEYTPVSFDNLSSTNDSPVPPDPNAKVIKMVYSSGSDITPSTFVIKKGEPVRFEVEVKDDGSGCMSTIMIPKLYNTPQYLAKGKTLTMDFTPKQTGTYQITCAMGVPRGTIEVIN